MYLLFKEQIHIANFLDSIDTKIRSTEKYLLQNMFV